MDRELRKQLVQARKALRTQLAQLEGANIDPYAQVGAPNSRSLYSKLQQELTEIDALLATDGRDGQMSKGDDLDYEPMTRLSADGSVGIPTGPTRSETVMAIVGLAMIVVWIGLVLWFG